MILKEIEKFNTIFTGWSRKEINIGYQMILFLRKLNIGIDKFEEYAKYLQQDFYNTVKMDQNIKLKMFEHYEENGKKCPDCGLLLSIDNVNISNCTSLNDKKIKSVFTCPNMEGCGYQEWNKNNASYYIRKINKGFWKMIENMSDKELLELDVDRSKVKFMYNTDQFSEQPKRPGGCGKKEKKNGGK